MDHTRTVTTFNPRTGNKLKDYPIFTTAEVHKTLESMHQAQLSWAKSSTKKRADFLNRLSLHLENKKTFLAECASTVMGKLPTEAVAEIEKCATSLKFYAEKAEDFLRPQSVSLDKGAASICFEPLGVVLAVMPWNFPFWQVMRCVGPNVLAGNGILLKHASNVTGCSLAIEQIFKDLAKEGFPQLLATVVLTGDSVLPWIGDRRIAAVSFTGSTPVGKKIAEACGRNLKKSVLELGGSDPYVILEDAAIEQAAEVCASLRLLNAGQSCISAKRFIVVRSQKERFEAAFREQLKNKTIAPLAKQEFCQEAQKQVENSIQMGARLLLGGEYTSGCFYPPTLLTDVKPGMPVFEEETFSPIAALIEAADEREALGLANKTSFGLGAALFTKNIERGFELAKSHLHAGSVFVNGLVKSDARLPFGGIKDSGYGRELSHFGLYEFCNVKTVVVF